MKLVAAIFMLAATTTTALAENSLPDCRSFWGASAGEGVPVSGESHEDFERRLPRERCEKDWTLLVYMAADNELEPYAWADLYEMEAGYASGERFAGSTLTTDVVVEMDSARNDEGTRRWHLFQSSQPYVTPNVERLAQERARAIESPVIEHLPEVDSSDAENLKAFLAWGTRRFPAKHYLVVVWGHGEGWLARAGAFGGVARDDSSGHRMAIPNLASALRDTSRALGRPVDLFATDTCLMQSVEVVAELAGAARPLGESSPMNYITASTDILSRAGIPYRRLLYELNSNGTTEPDRLAHVLPSFTAESFDPERGTQTPLDPNALETFTLSTLSTAELRGRLLPALENFARALNAYVAEDSLRALDLGQSLGLMPAYLGETRDLGGLVAGLQGLLRTNALPNDTASVAELRSALVALSEALDRTVLAYEFGNRHLDRGLESLGFKALAVWAPSSPAAYENRLTEYLESSLYLTENSEWARLWASIYSPAP